MLLERATGLATKISRYQTLKSAAKEAEIVRTRADQLEQVAALLAHARDALSRFAAAGVMIEFAPAHADDLSEKAKALRVIAAEAPVALAVPPFNFTHEFTNRLRGIATGADTAIRERWRHFITENSPGGSDEVLDALGKLPQLRAGVTQIRQCRQKIQALSAAPPADPVQAVAQLRALVAEHQAAWATLTTDNLPRTVILFLQACAGDGAPVTALTEEVRDWLEARNLLGSLRIRIG
jgi:hypothetical protein